MSDGHRITAKIPPRRSLLSIEIFPPKTETGITTLKERLRTFQSYAPEFISVTYGAGGSTRERTRDLVPRSTLSSWPTTSRRRWA